MRKLFTLSWWLIVMATVAVAQVATTPFEYQSPRPSAVSVSRQSAIILRPGPLLDRPTLLSPSLVAVTGATSGRHAGALRLARDGRTIVFRPAVPFAAGERVSVVLASGVRTVEGVAVAPREFAFTADATPDEVLASVRPPSEIEPADRLAAVAAAAAPTTDFPELTVTTVDNPAPGRIYLSNLAFNPQIKTTPFLMVLDNDAVPLFRARKGLPAYDFKRQPDGTVTYYDTEQGAFVILDSSYRQIGAVNASAGYQTDVHELQVLPNGNVLLLGLAPRRTDLSGIVAGGRTNAIVLEMVIEELEPDGTVVFEWRSADHFAVTDARFEDLTAETVDYVHPNSVALDTDGNILLSSRHLDEVTKISRTTGEILWRLGGKHNQFTFTNDSAQFSYQHDARRLANGHLLLFDNGNHKAQPESRAVEYRLDERAMTATRVWEYRHTPAIVSYAMGNAQRLPNGNTMIGWGANNTITEVRPDGSVAFEMKLPAGVFTYRAFRLPAATSAVTTELLAPTADTMGLPRTVELQWARTGGARSYRVQVATDPDFTSIVHDEASITTTRASVGGLLDWTQYYWRVKASGDEIDGRWSEAWSFTTGGTVIVQNLLAPPSGATGLAMAPVLQWAPFPGAVAYDVQMSQNDLFFADPTVDTSIAGTSLWLDRIAAGDRFYWRVRPVGSSGPGNWSQVWSFRTAAEVSATLPQRIEQVLPANASTLAPGDIRFLWRPLADAGAMTEYRLMVAATPAIVEDPATRAIVVDTTVETVEALCGPGVLTPSTYWWIVRATNALGEQFSSSLGTFTVDATNGVADAGGMVDASALTPNPAGASTLLRIALTRETALSVRLVDLDGRTVATPFSGVAAPGTRALTLRLDDLADGVYFCVITTPERTSAHRLVVAR